MNDIAADRARRVHRPWRLAFIAYALALTAGTHWPKLEIGTAAHPTDKIIHSLAFGGLTVLLWRTVWIGRLSLLALTMALWAPIDEVSQAIPGLGRSVSWKDVAAGYLGIVVALAWIWALQPVGGEANRLRLAQRRFALEEMFRRPAAWLSVVFAAVPIIYGLMSWSRTIEDWPPPLRRMLVIVVLLFVFIIGVVWLRREWSRMLLRCEFDGPRPCIRCGCSCRAVVFDSHGDGQCQTCQEPVHLAQWLDHAPLTARQLGIAMSTRAPVSIHRISGLLFAASVLLAGSAILLRQQPPSAHFPAWNISLPGDLVVSMIAGALAFFFAAATFEYRRLLAQLHDDPVICRHCGFDLRAAATRQGIGRCSECGTMFARISRAAASIESEHRARSATPRAPEL